MCAKNLVVLLVEDDPDHAEFVRRALRQQSPGVEVFVAVDGREALDYLGRRGAFADPSRSPRPDLVLLDLNLPKLDGFGVLRELKGSEQFRAIPAVILTTSDAEGDVTRAYAAHANSYLVKPPDYTSFMQLIAALDTYWREWNRELPAGGETTAAP